jgi:hypothetical protein
MYTAIESESLKERYRFGDLILNEMVIYEFMWLRIGHVKEKLIFGCYKRWTFS